MVYTCICMFMFGCLRYTLYKHIHVWRKIKLQSFIYPESPPLIKYKSRRMFVGYFQTSNKGNGGMKCSIKMYLIQIISQQLYYNIIPTPAIRHCKDIWKTGNAGSMYLYVE